MKASKTTKRAVAIAQPSGPKLWPYAAAFGAAVIAVFFVYGPALNGPFLLDDFYLPYQQDTFANAPLRQWLVGVRPMLMLSFWLNFQESGSHTGPYHFVNVLMHLFSSALVFLIAKRLLTWARVEADRIDLFAGFAATLFLLHPLQTEAVTYIASRSESQSVFFFLAAFAVFLYRRTPAISWFSAVAILTLFGAACLTKEHAAVLPVLLVLTDYYWNPGFSWEGVRKNWRLYILLAAGAVLAVAFIWRVLSAATSAGFGIKDLPWYQYLFTQFRAIWRYILLFFVPVGQNLDYDFPVSRTILDHGAIIGMIGLAVLIGAAWYYRRRVPLISYGIFTFLLLLAPTSSIVPIRDTLVERRMYLPFIGFLLVAVGLLQFWKTSRSTLITTLAVVLLVEAGLTYERNLLWSNPLDIWADTAAKSPHKLRPNFQLAYAYYNAGRCQEAVSEFDRASKVDAPDFSLYVDWALAADCAGNQTEALAKFQTAANMNPTAHTLSQLGMEYAKMAKYPQALDALDKSVKLDPNFGRSFVYRGSVHALQGNRAQAIADYRRALEIDPQDQYARENLMKLAPQ